jgi:glycosyltransferase involved in cell wall biosynthesis
MISAYKTALALAKKKGIEVVVITTKTKGSKAFEIVEGVRVHRLSCFYIPDPANIAIVPFLGAHLWKIIRKEKPDRFLVNKYMFYTSLSVLWLKLFGKKVTLQTDTFPGYCWFGPSKLLNVIIWIYTRTLGLLVLRMADNVILLHEGLIEPARNLGIKRFVVIHNGVDFDSIRKAKPAKDILKFRGSKILVTYMGRLDDVKGYKLALEAAKNIGKKKRDVKFLFVCGDKYPELREKLQKEYKFIKFAGFRDPEPIWKATDIHILPSYTEGLPNTVLEAMANNVAVIATKVGAVPYIIKDGKNGILIDKGSAKGLESAILKLVDDRKLLNGVKKDSRIIIEAEFNWKKLADKVLANLSS